MHLTAPCSTPTRLALGTRTESKTSSAVAEARMPHLSLMRCPIEKPSIPFSTMNSDRSLAPSPVRA